MSRFNDYAKRVNDLATAAFEEYRKAEKEYKAAEEQARKYPQRHGMVDAQYAAKSARAQADYLEAKEAFKKATAAFKSHNSEIAALRKELAEEIKDHYAADPAALDNATLELMKAGILKPNEYSKLMKKAQADGNHTMQRMIAKYAGEAAADIAKKYGEHGRSSEQARELRRIVYAAGQNDGSDTLASFDVLADVYSRATNNPALIDHWGELTAETVENF